MRIIFILHSFPPRIVAGTEMSVLRLAKALSPLHQVRVIHSEYDLFEPEGKVIHSSVEGIATSKIITHRLHRHPQDTYINPTFRKNAAAIINLFKPHIVHFHHFIEGDVGLVEELLDEKIGVIVTFHDYWSLCGRGGQMLRWDGVRCVKYDPEICADCLSRSPLPANQPLVSLLMSNLYRIKGATPPIIKGLIRGLRAPLESFLDNFIYSTQYGNPVPGEGPPCSIKDASPSERRWTKEEVSKRFDYFFSRLKKIRLISPSYFLKDIFVNNHYPSEKFRVIENGIPSEFIPPNGGGRKSEKVRFGFIGTPAPVKGVHEIILASNQLTSPHTLHIFGDTSIHPRYGSCLRKIAGRQVFFHGGKLPGKTAAMFNQIDVLVLPSLWWENAPIVLREARAFGKPSITSDIGGMKETIREGVDGWLVRPGDVGSLKSVMERLCRNPDEIREVANKVRPPTRIDEVIPEINEVYNEAVKNVE